MPHAAWAIIRSMPERFGQRRRGRQAGLALEHERGRGARIRVRQAADRGAPPRAEGRGPSSSFVLPSHRSPWSGHRENGHRRRAWANLGAAHARPRRSLARSRHVGAAAAARSGPPSATRSSEHSLAVARTASVLAWGTWAGVLVAVLLPTHREPHGAAHRGPRRARPRPTGPRSRAIAAVTDALAVAGAALAVVAAFSPADRRRVRQRLGVRRRAALPAARPDGRCCSVRSRSRASAAVAAPDRRPAPAGRARSGSPGAVVLAVGLPVAAVAVARAPRAGAPLGGARAGRPGAARPARARGAGAVPRVGSIRRLGPAPADAGRRDASTSRSGRSGWRWSWSSSSPSAVAPRRPDRSVQVRAGRAAAVHAHPPGALLRRGRRPAHPCRWPWIGVDASVAAPWGRQGRCLEPDRPNSARIQAARPGGRGWRSPRSCSSSAVVVAWLVDDPDRPELSGPPRPAGRVDAGPPHRARRVGRRVRLDARAHRRRADGRASTTSTRWPTPASRRSTSRPPTPGRAAAGVMEPDRLAPLIERAHDRGLHVVAWYLPTLVDVEADLRRLDGVGGPAVDGLAVDIESVEVTDVAERNRRLLHLSQRPPRVAGSRQGDRRHHPVGGAPAGGEPGVLAGLPVGRARRALRRHAADDVLVDPQGGAPRRRALRRREPRSHPRQHRRRRRCRSSPIGGIADGRDDRRAGGHGARDRGARYAGWRPLRLGDVHTRPVGDAGARSATCSLPV